MAAACNALWGIDGLTYDETITPTGVAGQGGEVGGGGSGGSAGAGAQPDPCRVDIDPACAQYASAYCGRVDTCAPFWMRYHWGSLVDCAARLGADCTRRLAALGTALTAGHMASCASGLLATGCDDLLGNRLPAACGSPPGPLQVGFGCDTGGQCETAFCAGEGEPGDCGWCSAVPDEGSACSDRCGPGLTCDGGICRPLGVLSDPCDDTAPCLDLYDCYNDVCTAPLGEGEQCDPAGQTTPACDVARGLGCDASDAQCAPVSWVGWGAACGLGILAFCDEGTCLGGTCVARAGDCEPCDPTEGPVCQPLAWCINGRCEPPLYQGCFGQQ